jgi:hypothetical protein
MNSPTTAATIAAAESALDAQSSRVDSSNPFAEATNATPAASINTNATT